MKMHARESKSEIGFWANAGALIESTMKPNSQSKTNGVKDIAYTTAYY